MFHGLTYPGIRCIIENLDLSKRILLASRAPAIQRVDKSIPFHVKSVHINENYFFLNNISVVYIPRTRELLFEDTHKEICRQVEPHLEKKKILEKMFNYYLGGRKNIYLDHVLLDCPMSELSLPPNLKLTINKMETRFCDFRDFLPIINARSFPLKEFTARDNKSIFLDHPVVHSAEKLVFHTNAVNMAGIFHDINKLPNKNILIKFDSSDVIAILNVIGNWLNGRKEVGTKYIFSSRFKTNIDEVLAELQLLAEHFKVSGTPYFRIPIDAQSSIQINGIEVNEDGVFVSQLVTEVVSTKKSLEGSK
ncbi:hypothetical protein GCK72_008021 [Caenorhabditis remanei]|uniref:F-box associated domain-containing protein n=1 Tax=Caenorhabditis remanei TaxID=31234 RepID=A0A6A5HIR9_CAERE|nr:hypothetical protein GCK72_008021 [Caenorhabditis remanei]KAF1768060.1 hypothetical protein GCK72_008021 [Caenorhabditis remanei]